MANKGSNTIILEAQKTLIDAVNNCTNIIPAAMVSIMLEGILKDLNVSLSEAIKKEQKNYEDKLELEKQQVEYVPEETNVTSNK